MCSRQLPWTGAARLPKTVLGASGAEVAPGESAIGLFGVAAVVGAVMPLLDLALNLAAFGLPVFPRGARKFPCIAKAEGGNGFHDATTD